MLVPAHFGMWINMHLYLCEIIMYKTVIIWLTTATYFIYFELVLNRLPGIGASFKDIGVCLDEKRPFLETEINIIEFRLAPIAG
jgi:hypothetical protein